MILLKIMSLLNHTCSDVAIFSAIKQILRVPIFVLGSFPIPQMATSFFNFKVSWLMRQ